MLTETQKNFVDSQGPTDPVQHDPTQSQGLSERKSGNVEDLSCVFRCGDYNVTQENAADRFKSINQKDFTTKEDVVSEHPYSSVLSVGVTAVLVVSSSSRSAQRQALVGLMAGSSTVA